MGCTSSVYAFGKKKKKIIPQVSIFSPSLRVPVHSDIHSTLRGLIPKDLAHRITSLRNQIVLVAEDTGGSAIAQLTRALEEYLSLLLGLAKKEYGLQELVEFRWKELEDGRQAHCCLSEVNANGAAPKKQMLFLKWKYLEAKAAAYYYHGLILDKGTEPSSHVSAVCCFLAAEELIAESKKACLTFCLAEPITRAPPPWGAMKHLHKKIPETASKKSQMYGYLLEQEKDLQTLPDLPEFQLSLKPDEYELPEVDPAWDCGKWEITEQTLKEHLNEDEPET
ncbi:UNVERIFIED_CONTAM: hypothetical protein Sangu_1305000 [Sesamum angustifolium]|uniref:BRO1 domain-containing protein n=1 Tax=Sesamum angustifolium TaxID=2727405 RepID=A0AAW2NLC6_9LAMI